MNKEIKFMLLVGVLFCGFSCQREYQEPQKIAAESCVTDVRKKPEGTCTEYFYYYGQTKVNLGTVQTSKIIIGFLEGTTLAEKESFISEYSFIQGIENVYNTGSADATVILLKDGLTCAEVEAALTQLENRPEVRYANPFFLSPDTNDLIGVTNQFILTLKPGYTKDDLIVLTKRTKSQIVEQLDDYTFILSADKYATGNALQLANEFANFYQVEISEPDFLITF